MIHSGIDEKGKQVMNLGSTAMAKTGTNPGCPEYRVDLSAYFDGELDGESLLRMEQHLQQCEGCQASLAKLRKLRSAMSELGRGAREGQSVLEALRKRLEDERDAENGPNVS